MRRPIAQQRFRRDLHSRQQVSIAQQIGNTHLRKTRLPSPQEFSRSAQFQIAARNLEPIIGSAHHFETQTRHRGERCAYGVDRGR